MVASILCKNLMEEPLNFTIPHEGCLCYLVHMPYSNECTHYSTITNVVCTKKNRLMGTVLLSTHNTCANCLPNSLDAVELLH